MPAYYETRPATRPLPPAGIQRIMFGAKITLAGDLLLDVDSDLVNDEVLRERFDDAYRVAFAAGEWARQCPTDRNVRAAQDARETATRIGELMRRAG